jgi:hypothetical protein
MGIGENAGMMRKLMSSVAALALLQAASGRAGDLTEWRGAPTGPVYRVVAVGADVRAVVLADDRGNTRVYGPGDVLAGTDWQVAAVNTDVMHLRKLARDGRLEVRLDAHVGDRVGGAGVAPGSER